MVKKVIWPLRAQNQLEKAYQYILANSEIHPLDKYRKNNDGRFRAYELHRYRIAYRITEKEIIIVRILHTSLEPREY